MEVQSFFRPRPNNTFTTMVLGTTVFTATAVKSARGCTCSVKETETYLGIAKTIGVASNFSGLDENGSTKRLRSLKLTLNMSRPTTELVYEFADTSNGSLKLIRNKTSLALLN